MQYNAVFILFQHSALKSVGACPALDGEISYIVEQLDTKGNVVEQKVVHPGNCTGSVCTAMISPTSCAVQVNAISKYGSSNLAFLQKGKCLEWLIALLTTIIIIINSCSWKKIGNCKRSTFGSRRSTVRSFHFDLHHSHYSDFGD